MVDTYRDLGVFDQDVETALGAMHEWYDGYRFLGGGALSSYQMSGALASGGTIRKDG